MALVTPEEWLPVLAARLDFRQTDIARLRSYVDGNAPLPEMGPNTRATWIAFQKKSRVNYGGSAVSSHANRIRVRGVRVGSDDQSEASKAARRIARDNRLSMQVGDAIRDMLAARNGYLVAGVGEDGRALITSEKPEMFYAEPDAVRPWVTRAAIKVWRDSVAELDHALVWVVGSRQQFVRRSYTTSQDLTDKTVRMVSAGGWMVETEPEMFDGNPPVWIFDREDGKSLVEPHTDLIDQINLGKLQRLVTTAMQAFRLRALKKDAAAPAPPTVDDQGNPIDYSKVYEIAPGALLDLPEGIDVWESQTTDITPLLSGEMADKRSFAAMTGTPMTMIQPDSANQSATGAAATTAQQVDACNSDIDRIKLAAAAVILTALRIEGVDFGDDTVEVDFENPAWVTLAEKMDAYSKAIAAGMSIPMAQKEILGWDQPKIDEDDAHRRRAAARDSMQALVAGIKAGPPATPMMTQPVGQSVAG